MSAATLLPGSTRLAEISRGGTRVVIDLDLGAELRWLGPDTRNLLASYDWLVEETVAADPGQEWLRHYRGGWQTLFPNIGTASSWRGIPLGHHGSWSRTPVEVLAQERHRLVVTAPAAHGLRLTRDLQVTASGDVEISQSIENTEFVPVPYLLGEHPAFDLPAGSTIELPAGPVVIPDKSPEFGDLIPGGRGAWPEAPGPAGPVDLSVVPVGPVERTAYLPGRSIGAAAVRFPETVGGLRGFRLEWDAAVFPEICLWQQIGGRGEPYLGRTRITAIELLSTLPADGLEAAVEGGRASWLAPGERRSTDLAVRLLRGGVS